MKLYRQKLFSSLGSDVVFEFLGRLSGFIHRAKTLHWSAKGKDIHEYLDSFWKELYEFQDTVAEGWMGIAGKLSDASEVPCIPADSNNPMSFVREVESRTLEFYEQIPADDPRFKGLTGETESFIQTIEKYKYLFSLCFEESNEEKEFSDKEKKKRNILGGTLVLGSSAAGATGGYLWKNKGQKKLKQIISDINQEKAGIAGNQSTHEALYEAAKASGEAGVHADIEKQMQSLKEKVAEGNKNIEGLEKSKEELLKKIKKNKRGGKALVAASVAAPVAYFGVKAIKKHKNKK